MRQYRSYLYFIVALIPVLGLQVTVASTEIAFQLSTAEKYELTQMVYTDGFDSIPANPNVYETVQTYSDFDLNQVAGTISPNERFTIINQVVNHQNQVVFQLSDQTYILADTSLVYDDQIITSQAVDATYWTKDNFTVWSSPIGNQAKKISTKLSAYQSISISEIAETQAGIFAKVGENQWISLDDLSETDNRIDAVQEMLEKKYNKSNISIFVKQLSTDRTAGVNQSTMMYAASVTKLPVLYYTQQLIDEGQYALTDNLKYTKETNEFTGSYDPSGSGSIVKTADNKNYTVGTLIDKVAKESDNAASNILAYYVTNQFDESYYDAITAITGTKWDMETRQASAEMAGLMMEAIYKQDGGIIDSLSSTNFDNQRISRDIDVQVAHKIGDAYDYRHDVAIVYAEDPFILSVFTNESTYDTISQIANDVYEILK